MDAFERHEETVRQKNRTRLLVFLLFLTLAVLLSALFILFACRYEQTDFSIIRENDPACIVKDGFLYPKTEDSAVYSYHLNTGDLSEYPVTSLDLSGFTTIGSLSADDLEAPYSYFRYENKQIQNGEETVLEARICASDPALAPLNRANDDRRFVRVLNDGRKLWVDLDRRTAQPLFYGSAEGVDEYGVSISEFSYLGGKIAAGVENDALLLYRREDDGFAITDFQTIDLSAYGKHFNLFFCNERYLQLCGEQDGNRVYLVCDAQTGEIRPSPIKESAKQGDLYLTPYGRAYLFTRAQPDKNSDILVTALTLGTETKYRFPDKVSYAFPLAISTTGAYAVFKTYETDEQEQLRFCAYTVGKSGSKQADLTSCVNEDERFVSATFLSDTILALTVRGAEGAESQKIVKICF